MTRYVVVGMLGLAVMLAVFPPSSGPRSALVDSVRSVTFTFVMAAAFIAATQLGTEFKRGAAVRTYLTHPNRRTVATARVLTYGLIGGLLAALAAIVALVAGSSGGRALTREPDLYRCTGDRRRNRRRRAPPGARR